MTPSGPNPPPREIASVSDLILRVTWFFAGPVALLGLAYAIVVSGSGWLTLLDLAFVVVVALMIGARRVELQHGVATTATGEPATAADVQRYTFGLLIGAAGLWIIINVVGNHLMG